MLCTHISGYEMLVLIFSDLPRSSFFLFFYALKFLFHPTCISSLLLLPSSLQLAFETAVKQNFRDWPWLGSPLYLGCGLEAGTRPQEMRPYLKGQTVQTSTTKMSRTRSVPCAHGSSCPPLIPHLKYLKWLNDWPWGKYAFQGNSLWSGAF